MASPSVTQSNINTDNSKSSISMTMPAFSGTDNIWCVVATEKNSSTTLAVNSVTSSGLTFTKIFEQAGSLGGIPYTVSVWCAPLGPGDGSGSLSAQSTTVALSASCDAFVCCFFGTKGTASNNPVSQDPNVSMPAFSAATNPSVTISTDRPHDLLLCAAVTNSGSFGGRPAEFTSIQSGHTWPVNYTGLDCGYLSESTTQSSVTFTPTTGTNTNELLVLAITADAAGATRVFAAQIG